MTLKTLLAATALVVGATGAQAASITINSFDATDYNNVLGGFNTTVVEDFETFGEGNVGAGFGTAVGTFDTIGGTGTGGSVTDSIANGNFAGNDGSLLAVRDGNVFGRTNTTGLVAGLGATDGMFLDSNDTFGISWSADLGGAMFNKILLTLSDGADISGTTLTVSAGGSTQSFTAGANGNKRSVIINFGTHVTTASVLFTNTHGGNERINDGFSLDDIVVGSVPLPASALFLLAGLGGLGAIKRRRKTA